MMLHGGVVMYQRQSQFMFPIFCQQPYLMFYQVSLSALSMYIALFFVSDINLYQARNVTDRNTDRNTERQTHRQTHRQT